LLRDENKYIILYCINYERSVKMRSRKKELLFSLKRSVPIMIGYFPVGIAYGILMQKAGYNFLWSAASSLFIYAGSLQMLAVSFLASGAPLLTVIIAALLLNSRHIFYGISFIDKFKAFGPAKYFLIYGLSDESYSLLCAYKPDKNLNEKTVHILTTVFIWSYWIIFSALGGLIGEIITFDTTGIDFALTALFTVILVDRLKSEKTPLSAIVGAAASVICLLIFGADNFLLPALAVACAALMLLRPIVERRNKVK